MVFNLPALQAKAPYSWGRKVEPQGETGGQLTGNQGTPKGGDDIQPQVEEGKERDTEDCLSDKGNKNECKT